MEEKILQKEHTYISVGKINKNQVGNYKEKIITEDVILTQERLNTHILVYHREEYYQIKDNSHIDTLIYLKHIQEIDKRARIVIKLATNRNEATYTKNSIITIMRQRDKSWEQTIKNRGRILFQKD